MTACNKKNNSTNDSLPTNNKELIQIYEADQADRISKDSTKKPLISTDIKLVIKKDSERRKRVYELLDANLVKTAKDYKNAAMIFQHGLDTTSSAMAVKLMKKAIKMDTTINKWLLAAAIDRDLMWRKEPQIYGTQHILKPDGTLELYKIDTTKITDEERIEYGVPVLSELLKKNK